MVMNMKMIKPKLYLDRETLDEDIDNYLFVSYSHKDYELVFNILNYLYSKFVNYWYDYDLTTGKRWDEEVIKFISNSHCKGCLCFVSKSYLKSDACKEEYFYMKSLTKSGFHFYPIFLEEGGIEKMVLDIPKDELKIADMNQKDSLLCKEVLYQTPKKESLDILIKDIKKVHRSVINDKECILLGLLEEKRIRRKDQFLIATIGRFPQKNAISLNREANGKIITNEWDEEFYGSTHSGLFYPLDLIEWRIIDANQDYISLISNKCLIPVVGQIDKVSDLINDVYRNCFTQEEQQHIELSMANEVLLNHTQYLLDIKGTEFYENNYFFAKDIYWILKNQELLLVGKNFQTIKVWSAKETIHAGVIFALKIETNYFKKWGKRNGTK